LWTGGEDSSHPFSGEKLDSQSCGNNFLFCNFSLVICCGLGDKTLLTLSQVKKLESPSCGLYDKLLLCNFILVIYCGKGEKNILPTVSRRKKA
jgi:hypothetical protein